MKYFNINVLETNEKRNQLYLKNSEIGDEYYFVIDFIKNEICMNDGRPALHKDFYKISNHIDDFNNLSYYYNYDKIELWQFCYMQNLANMINVNLNWPYSEYTVFKRAFINHKYGDVFKRFSPIIEKISKKGIIFTKNSYRYIEDNFNTIQNWLKYYSFDKDYIKCCSLIPNFDDFIHDIYIQDIINNEKQYKECIELNSTYNSIYSIFPHYNLRSWLCTYTKEILFLIKTCKYDLKRLIQYLTVDVDWQGLEPINFMYGSRYCNETFTTFYDYVKMSYDIYENTNFDKYPKYLATYHDIIAKNYKTKEDEIIKKQFSKVMEKYNYDYSYNQFIIKVPTDSSELIKEGSSLHHCVGSYIKRVINEENIIVFGRLKKNPNESLLTIDIKNGKINQVEGMNRRKPNKEEKQFLIKFAQKYNLDYSYLSY